MHVCPYVHAYICILNVFVSVCTFSLCLCHYGVGVGGAWHKVLLRGSLLLTGAV